jgi:hypothetical protein
MKWFFVPTTSRLDVEVFEALLVRSLNHYDADAIEDCRECSDDCSNGNIMLPYCTFATVHVVLSIPCSCQCL